MIQKLNKVLEYAEKKGCAVGAFTPMSFDVLRAIIEIAEKRNEPIIIKHSHTYEEEVPLKYMGPVIIELAKKSKVDICPMLDHCKSFEYMKEGLKMGFTAVMYDGAGLSLEDNIKIGKEVVSVAKSADANIEAAFGVVGGHKNTVSTITNVDELMKFIKEVDIDALAPSVGNTHNAAEVANINFNLLKEISEKTHLPLVLHGASGLPKDVIKKTIECGVRKVNYFSTAGIEELKEYLATAKGASLPAISKIVVDAVSKDINEAMSTISMK